MLKLFHFDKVFFWITMLLVGVGLLIFLSASFSAFAETEKFKSILFGQLVLGLGGGAILFFAALRIPLETLRKYSIFLYGIGVILLIIVLIPGIGIEHGGARRWLDLGPLSFQPVEYVKYATIIYVSAWLSVIKTKVQNFSQGLIPLLLITGLVGGLLLIQPDTDSFLVIIAASFCIYFLAGAKWRDLLILLAAAVVLLGGLLVTRPYLMERVRVFIDPSYNQSSSSYQVNQQLIAIGSGGIAGRGFGQGIQKFKYLPEPLGDSIFAVVGEEFGFIGALVMVTLYILFFFRGMYIAVRAKDSFGKLLVVGIVGLVVFQSFYNIASAIGVLPLGGLPLMFVSHGGTALAAALAGVGLILNVSRGATLK